MGSPIYARASGISGSVDARIQVLARSGADRQRLRRSQFVLHLPADVAQPSWLWGRQASCLSFSVGNRLKPIGPTGKMPVLHLQLLRRELGRRGQARWHVTQGTARG